jgi:hypothetical protein
MIFSQSRLLRLVAPHLSPALVDPAAVDAIAGFAERLPHAFTWGILELRLASGDARADIAVVATRFAGSRAALAEVFADARHAEREPAALGALGPLLHGWAAGLGRLSDVPYLGLEYDHPASGRSPPFVFLAIDPDVCRSPERPLDDVIALAREGLTLALGELDPVPFATWERCARLLPPGGRVATTAPLAARGRRDLRLDASLPHQTIAPWLDAIGWPGERRQLELLLDLLGSGWQRNNLQLDLGAAVGPMLGILFRPPAAARDRQSWRPLLDRLYALGVCARDKGEAALDWIGVDTIDLPDLDWPVAVQRDLDFKLTLLPGGRLEVKSYLSYHAAWASL